MPPKACRRTCGGLSKALRKLPWFWGFPSARGPGERGEGEEEAIERKHIHTREREIHGKGGGNAEGGPFLVVEKPATLYPDVPTE